MIKEKAFYLKLKYPPKESRYIFCDGLEEILALDKSTLIYKPKMVMGLERWKYAREFKTKQEAQHFKICHDEHNHYKIVDKLK